MEVRAEPFAELAEPYPVSPIDSYGAWKQCSVTIDAPRDTGRAPCHWQLSSRVGGNLSVEVLMGKEHKAHPRETIAAG